MKHSILGASGATRWINCPGSIRETRRLPARFRYTSSAAADLGTAAHYLGELCLRDGEAVPEMWAGQEIPGEHKGWVCDDDMIQAVTIYVEYVRRRQREMNADMYIEVSVKPLPEFDDMFGTGDCILVEPWGEIEVIDYKNGSGVYVSEIDNDQMNFYALGALQQVGPRDVGEVTTTIVQPRCSQVEPVRPWKTSPQHLLEYGDILRAARAATEKPDAPLVAGDHCRFCPVGKAGACPALEAQKDEVVQVEFSDLQAKYAADEAPVVEAKLPDPDDPQQMWLARQMIAPLKAWISGVEAAEQTNLEHGVPVRGRKLVRKRANRQLRDPAATKAELESRDDLSEDDYLTPRKLKSPAQLEKNPKIDTDWVKGQAYTPEGGVTVADESDPRPAVTLLDEFAGLAEEYKND